MEQYEPGMAGIISLEAEYAHSLGERQPVDVVSAAELKQAARGRVDMARL